MKLLLLVCVAVAAGSPLRSRSNSASVYDYYDHVDIPRMQPLASSRADGPPRRHPPPRHQPQRRPSPPKHQPSRLRPEDYRLAGSEILRPAAPVYQHNPRPQAPYRPLPSNKYRPQEAPVRYREDPIYVAEDPVYVGRPQYEEKPVVYEDEPIVYREEPVLYEELPDFHGSRPPFRGESTRYQQERPPYQSERPVYPDPYQPKRPAYQEERPQFVEDSPQYHDVPQYYEERPQYEEPVLYEDEAIYEAERPVHEEKHVQETTEKDYRRPPLNDFTPVAKEEDSVKEKRQAHGGGHLDAAGEKFASDAAAVENAKGAGRLAFQIHGQQGPHSYRFGYDTGKGKNRQFRYEERDAYGQVHGRYGFYDKDGKLQVVNYSAHPEHGFSADVPHP